MGKNREKKLYAEKSRSLNDTVVRKPLLVSSPQRSEELRLYSTKLIISNRGLKAVPSTASPG
jgi:hypothetical protein